MSVSPMFRAITRCVEDGHPNAYWAQKHYSNGSVHLVVWCDCCARPVTRDRGYSKGSAVTREVYASICPSVAWEALPIVGDRPVFRLCRWCDVWAPCELHHIAPRIVFGADADRFPIVPLCDACHKRVSVTWERYVRERIAKHGRAA